MENKKYQYTTAVRDNEKRRESFNKLTQRVFGFDFADWYQRGGWGELYVPHVLHGDGTVVSNVSVNFMRFLVNGTVKNYIQLGTVMTAPEERGRGWNRELMERVLETYQEKADGIYLFGNDSVREYYPKFGFRASKEYEYYFLCDKCRNGEPYLLEKINLSEEAQAAGFYDMITGCSCAGRTKETSYLEDFPGIQKRMRNENDALYMSENLGLYQFWMAAEYGEAVYYLPEAQAYLVAEVKGEVLHILQVFSRIKLEPERIAASFGAGIREVLFGFTPVWKEKLCVREHKEEDCTLFILGKDLERMEREKMMFPLLSHA